jgi:cellulose synthase/poly-beta-1,6-N-acetylglucosamine synthase-like glycosyltransferase
MIIPVCNEEARIERKLANTESLCYPADRLQVVFVSDGSSDRTVELFRRRASSAMTLLELPIRRGKAAALNAGLQYATNEIIVFSDAAIELEPNALQTIVRRFCHPNVGCISGEDQIPESGGEAWYGRYEMLVRRLESKVHSIVGASGSFYAQRRELCEPFPEGMAPDFLSVLRTIGGGLRAVCEPEAAGRMTSVKDPRQEFERKVRTLLRGMTTLFSNASILNPLRFGMFSFELLSHKVMRWFVPFFLVALLASSFVLKQSPWFMGIFLLQLSFYVAALLSLLGWERVRRSLIGKMTLYFSVVNAAIVVAWFKFGKGQRQELWTPTQR